jgi:hypothetical protein
MCELYLERIALCFFFNVADLLVQIDHDLIGVSDEIMAFSGLNAFEQLIDFFHDGLLVLDSFEFSQLLEGAF